jgi:hypothetical protein
MEAVSDSVSCSEFQDSCLYSRPFGGPIRMDFSPHVASDHADDIIKEKTAYVRRFYRGQARASSAN